MTFRSRVTLVVSYCVAVILVNLAVVSALSAFSNANPTASYVLMIPLVTLGLIYQDRKEVFSEVRVDWRFGLPLVGAGFALMVAGALGLPSLAATLPMRVAAVVILWVGGFVLFCGRSAAGRALFPLSFLVFTIPIPESVLAVAVQVLKIGSTEAVDGLFALTGTVHHREGFVFSLPGVTIEIADECSGIRSSIAMLLTGLLAGHVFLRKVWTKGTLLLAVVPMAIMKNAIRIVALTLLSVHVDPRFLTGQLHHEGGFLFFVLALALSAPILLLLRMAETRRTRERSLAI
jgi:exosortase